MVKPSQSMPPACNTAPQSRPDRPANRPSRTNAQVTPDRGADVLVVESARTPRRVPVPDSHVCLHALRNMEAQMTLSPEVRVGKSLWKAMYGCVSAMHWPDAWLPISHRTTFLSCAPLIQDNPEVLKELSLMARDDADIVRLAVLLKGSSLKHAGRDVRDDAEIVECAVGQDGQALEFASARLRADKKVVLRAVEQDGMALKFAASSLQDDESLVRVAIRNKGTALQFASERLRSVRSVVEDAIAQDQRALKFSANNLRYSDEMLAFVIQCHGYAVTDYF